MRTRLIAFLAGLIPFLIVCIWWFGVERHKHSVPVSAPSVSTTNDSGVKTPADTASDVLPTNISAHNLLLRKGPNFRFYVRWLRGQMARARRNVNPSFDDPESFYLDIKTGVLRANIGDIGIYLNSIDPGKSPLKNIKLSGDGDQIKLNATVHKIIPLPIEILGTLKAVPDNRIQIHVTKINVLKIPIKALLGRFQVTVSDLFKTGSVPGIEVSGNDILLDTQELLPPPHIRGHLSKVHVVNPDLEEVYGDAEKDVTRVEQWRNFLRLSGGTIDFGKLTMHHVDLMMIDISKDSWFDLDLANYQEQLVNGYTRMTPEAGLQIFMPDMREIPQTATNKSINIAWFKNRNLPPPPDVIAK